ncbi:hypothetical protein LTR27_002729 [Elasticomyces elasticus]|nr:hypothetical protein LTR27_002729 [Elasticomyces elasticus]
MMTTPSSSTGPASPKPVSKKRKRPANGKTMVNNGRNKAGGAACYQGDKTIPPTVLALQSAVLNCSRVRNGFPDTRHVLSVTHSTDFRVDGTIRTQKREGAVSVLNEWAGDTRVFDGRMWARLLTRGNDWITHRFNNRGAVTPAQDHLMGAVTDHGDMGVAARLAGGVYNPRTAQASTAVATNPGPQQSAGPIDSVAKDESTASALPGAAAETTGGRDAQMSRDEVLDRFDADMASDSDDEARPELHRGQRGWFPIESINAERSD